MKKHPAVNELSLVELPPGDSARPAMNAAVRHIAEGLSDAQHGRVVSNEAMISWLCSWGDNDEQDAPLCRDEARGDGHS